MNFDDILNPATMTLVVRRWHILVLTLVASFLLAMVAFALITQTYHITATVVGTRYQSDITPSNQQMSFSASALLGGTANDLPPITDFRLYQQLLTSPEVGASIINEPVMHQVFSKSWHQDHWAPPDTSIQHIKNIFYSLMGRSSWSEPDGFTVAAYLTSNITVVGGKDAKVLTLSTWNRDPELGKELLRLVNSRADGMVKLLAQKRFKAKVAFLEKALSGADVQETRTALGQALAKAETDEIYSFSDLPFAAEFVQLPDTPRRPQFPTFALVSGAFVAFGVIAFSFYIVWIKRKEEQLMQRAKLKTVNVAANRQSASSRDF
jgi:hypothetical protein